MGYGTRNFYGKVAGKTIYDFSRALNYRLDNPEERIELINSLIFDEDGHLDKYFEEVFTQKFDLKSENLYEDMEDLDDDIDLEKLTFTGVNVSNVKLILSKDDGLYSETNLAKELEKMANYIIFCGERDKKVEYKVYKDAQLFNKMMKEQGLGDGSGEEMDNAIHILLEKNQNFKLEAKQVVYEKDKEEIELLADYDKFLQLVGFRLRKIALLEKMFGKTKAFTLLDELTHEDECSLRQYNVNKEELSVEMYKEAQRYKPLLMKHSALVKQDMLDVKDSVLGTIYFKSPLSDSNDIDYEGIDWTDEKHIKALLRIAPKGNDFQEDMVCIQYDLDKLLKEMRLSKEENYILKLYRQSIPLETIGLQIEKSKKTVQCCIDRISKGIVELYKTHYEDWHYTYVEKGEYRTCSKCTETILLNKKSFAQRKNGDYYKYCRDCGNGKNK